MVLVAMGEMGMVRSERIVSSRPQREERMLGGSEGGQGDCEQEAEQSRSTFQN